MISRIMGWIGSLFGVIGAVLLSLNTNYSGYGYVFFLISSTVLAAWSVREKHEHQLLMYVVFTCININGCYQWLF